jgi:putative restriction endonuclease
MTRPEQAVQVWQVLVGAAFYRQTLTYTLLADRIGIDAGAVAFPLGMVNRYCSMKQLPPLTVLVVRSDAGTPAGDLTWTTDVDFAREAVYQLEWFKLKPPSANDFALVENMGFGE